MHGAHRILPPRREGANMPDILTRSEHTLGTVFLALALRAREVA